MPPTSHRQSTIHVAVEPADAIPRIGAVATADQLTLSERLFLLGHDPTRGFRSLVDEFTLGAALAGAVLADLVLTDWVTVSFEGRVLPVDGNDHRRPVDRLGVTVLRLVRGEQAVLTVQDLITHLRPQMYDRTRAALIAEGWLVRTDRRAFGVFTRSRYVPVDERLMIHVRSDVRAAVHRTDQPQRAIDAVCAFIRAIKLLDAFIPPLPTDELIQRLNHVARRIAVDRSPYRAVADIAAVVEAVVNDRVHWRR